MSYFLSDLPIHDSLPVLILQTKFDFIDYKDEYTRISKSTLVQEASKIFNEAKINPKKCIEVLNKIIYLLNQVRIFHLNLIGRIFH